MEGISNYSQQLVEVNQSDSGNKLEIADLCTNTHIKKRRKKLAGDVLICQICGHRALGYNFNAVTCEACKSFFRRNANKTEIPTCCLAGKCPLDQQSRKLCSGCRLNKCFEVGMKKEWIHGKEQLKQCRENKIMSGSEKKTCNSLKMMVMSQPVTKPVMSHDMTAISAQPMTKPVISQNVMALSQPMTKPFMSLEMTAITDQQMTKPVMSHKMMALSQPMNKPFMSLEMTALTDQQMTKPVMSHKMMPQSQPMNKPFMSFEMTAITDKPMTKPVMSHKMMPLSQPMTKPFMSLEMTAITDQPMTKPVMSHKMMPLSQPMTKPFMSLEMTAITDQPMTKPVMSHKTMALSQPMTKPFMSLEMTTINDQPTTKPVKSHEMMAMSQLEVKPVMAHEKMTMSKPMAKPKNSHKMMAMLQPMNNPVVSNEVTAMCQSMTKPFMLHEMMAMSKLITNSGLKSESCRIHDSGRVTYRTHSNYKCFPEITSVSPNEKTNSDDVLQPLHPELEADIHNLAETYKNALGRGLTENNIKKVLTKPCNANELFTMSEILIRNLIKFVKLLPDFKSMEQHDQVILLKEGMMEVIVLRSALNFDAVNHKWKIKCKQNNESTFINASILLKQLGESVYTEHMEFAQSLKLLTNMDSTIIALILVQAIFSPDRPHLKNRAAVIQTRDKFNDWLHRYLQSLLSVKNAQSVYEKILMKLLDMRQLAERFAKMTLNLDAAKLGPLVVEVLVPQKEDRAVEVQWGGNSVQI